MTQKENRMRKLFKIYYVSWQKLSFNHTRWECNMLIIPKHKSIIHCNTSNRTKTETAKHVMFFIGSIDTLPPPPFFRSLELLRWPIEHYGLVSVAVRHLLTTSSQELLSQSLPILPRSICRVRRQGIVNLVSPIPRGDNLGAKVISVKSSLLLCIYKINWVHRNDDQGSFY